MKERMKEKAKLPNPSPRAQTPATIYPVEDPLTKPKHRWPAETIMRHPDTHHAQHLGLRTSNDLNQAETLRDARDFLKTIAKNETADWEGKDERKNIPTRGAQVYVLGKWC